MYDLSTSDKYDAVQKTINECKKVNSESTDIKYPDNFNVSGIFCDEQEIITNEGEDQHSDKVKRKRRTKEEMEKIKTKDRAGNDTKLKRLLLDKEMTELIFRGEIVKVKYGDEHPKSGDVVEEPCFYFPNGKQGVINTIVFKTGISAACVRNLFNNQEFVEAESNYSDFFQKRERRSVIPQDVLEIIIMGLVEKIKNGSYLGRSKVQKYITDICKTKGVVKYKGTICALAQLLKKYSLVFSKPKTTCLIHKNINDCPVEVLLFKIQREYVLRCYDAKYDLNFDETSISLVEPNEQLLTFDNVNDDEKIIPQYCKYDASKRMTLGLSVNRAGSIVQKIFIARNKKGNPKAIEKYNDLAKEFKINLVFTKSSYIDGNIFINEMKLLKQRFNGNDFAICVDGHGSHKKDEAIDFAKENGIYLYFTPPGLTWLLQPVDRTVMGPFKQSYKSKWNSNNCHLETSNKGRIRNQIKYALEAINSITAKTIKKGFDSIDTYLKNLGIEQLEQYACSADEKNTLKKLEKQRIRDNAKNEREKIKEARKKEKDEADKNETQEKVSKKTRKIAQKKLIDEPKKNINNKNKSSDISIISAIRNEENTFYDERVMTIKIDVAPSLHSNKKVNKITNLNNINANKNIIKHKRKIVIVSPIDTCNNNINI